MDIVVIGPIDGFHLLGYYTESSNSFHIIQKFCSRPLADMTAWRMIQTRQQGNK
jgi:hypothetical protein